MDLVQIRPRLPYKKKIMNHVPELKNKKNRDRKYNLEHHIITGDLNFQLGTSSTKILTGQTSMLNYQTQAKHGVNIREH